MAKKYTLGLDIGTQSVGWALIDENNDIVKKYGHHLWGVRLFDASCDSKTRRLNRCNRRRYQRRRERIELLRGLFKNEMDKIDKDFFIRLDDSFYDLEDSRIPSKDILNGYLSNSQYNKLYGPTIWHLRKYLIEHKNEKIDLRLLYLTIHHIIKYRGNFLSPLNEFKIENNLTIKDNIEKFNDAIRAQRDAYESILNSELYEEAENFLVTIDDIDENLINNIENIVKEKEIIINGENIENRTKNDKKRNLVKLLNCKGNIIEYLFVSLLISGSCDFSKIKLFSSFGKKPDVKIDFSIDNFDEVMEESIRKNPNEYNLISAVRNVKQIYEQFYLQEFLGDENYISFAMVNKFNEYKNDLSILKKLFKKYLPEKYSDFFRIIKDKYNNYAAYTGSTNFKNNKGNIKQTKLKITRINQETFYKELKKELENILKKINNDSQEDFNDIEVINNIKDKIEENIFLQRIRSKHNGVLPYQLHEIELNEILKNQSKFYEFLNVGEPTTKEKILTLLKFKRPYYIGPIAGYGDNKWAIFKEGKEKERVFPWNFEDIIDYDASANEFIRRMQNKCTYLKGERDYCLPKYSLIYQEYNVYNYINKIKVNGKSIDNVNKEKVLKLFKTSKNPTAKKIANVISPSNPDIVTISECNVSLSSYVTFNDNINEFKNKIEENYELIEEIIESITLFEDKVILEKQIKDKFEKYNFKISEESIKKIKSFNFKGYGRLSKKLLKGISFIDTETGEIYNDLLDALHQLPYNFMEILNNKNLTFSKEIDGYNLKNSTLLNSTDNNFEDYVKNELMISPIWVRSFIQSYKIIEEVEKIIGQKIDYFAIECTREEDIKTKKEQTLKRKEKIKQLLNSVKQIAKDILIENKIDLNKLKTELSNKENLNEDKLFLYFQQCGKDMYTLEDISLNRLNDYDIDHIYPQSLIKDDSISNRVLTHKSKNNDKQNEFLPILAQKGFLHKDAYNFYKFLYKNNFISKKKYERLIEREVDEVAINNFVDRQKTATDQAVKALIDALKNFKRVDTTHIIYSKASIISDFRKTNHIYKSREANNFHHAHDAYLNAFIGKTLQFYFNSIGTFFEKDYVPSEFYEQDKNDSKYTRNTSKILSYKVRRLPTNNSIIWNGKNDILKIKNEIYNNFDIRITHHTTRKNGFISKITNGGKNGQSNVALKRKTPNGNNFDMKKYGGYGTPLYMYMKIYKCIDKKNTITYKLIPINKLYFVDKEAYLKNRMPKNTTFSCVDDNLIINFNSCFEFNKTRYRITGTSGSRFVALNNKERTFNKDIYNSIYAFYKTDKKINDKNKTNIEENFIKNQNGELSFIIYKNKENKNNDFVFTSTQLKSIYDDLIYKKSLKCFDYENVKNTFSIIEKKFGTTYADTISTSNEFRFLFNIVKEMLGVLKINERKTIDLTKIYTNLELKKEKNISKNAAVITFGNNLEKGTKIYSYSPTGFYRKLLFEVK